MIEEDNENRSLPVTCGACGEAGGVHDSTCVTITDRLGHSRRVQKTIDALNIVHALRSACAVAIPHIEKHTVSGSDAFALLHARQLLEWATERELYYEARLDGIFPFHRG